MSEDESLSSENTADPTRQQSPLKKSEPSTGQGEEFSGDIIDSLEDVIFRLSADGMVLFVSKAVNIQFGIDRTTIEGRSFLEMAVAIGVDPEELDFLIEDQMEARSATVEKQTFEFSISRKARREHFEVAETHRYDPNGSFLGSVGTIRNITERKSMEEKIEALNEIFHLLGTDTRQNIDCIVARATDILGGVCSLYNRLDDSRKSLVVWSGKNLPEDMDPMDKPVGHICYEATIQGANRTVAIGELKGTVFETSDPNVSRYGLRSYLGHPVRRQGEAIGSLCIVDVEPREFSDVEMQTIATLATALSLEEERALTVAELSREKAFEKSLIDTAPGIILVLDGDGAVVTFNRFMEEFSGYRQDEVRGKDWLELFIDRAEWTRAREFFCAPTPSPGSEGRIIPIRIRNGSRKLIEWHGRELYDTEGMLNGTLMVGMDVTNRKRIEQEALAVERKLRHTQKLESLGILAGGLAHDFNNLLAAILGNAELAMRKLEEGSPALNNIEAIEKTALRSADLCRQMLAYSGKGDLVKEKLNPAELTADTIRLLEVSIGMGVVLRCDFAEETPPVLADATQLRQVVMNLITNASEAIGEGPGTVTISTGGMRCSREYLDECYVRDDLQEGQYSFISVRDDGQGIPIRDIDRLFDPFFTTKSAGRGLGLSAVLGIIRGHGGTIRISSETNIGTEIKVLLPSVVSSRRPGEDVHESPDRDWTGRGTVLLVDDEEFVRNVGRQLLENMGFSVMSSRNGEEALEIFRRAHKDLSAVLLDHSMPRMNGIRCFELMRRHDDSVPIVLSSGFIGEQVLAEYGEKGPDSFLQKPFRMNELRNVMREITEG